MAAEDDALEDELDGLDDGDVVSGPRAKKSSPAGFQLMLADFKARTQGLEPGEIQEELDRFIERLIERHVSVAPEQMRESLRASMRARITNDATFRRVIAEIRASAAAPRR